LVTGQATLGRIAEAMLSARATLQAQYEKLHKAVLAIVREDAVCRRLMSYVGVRLVRSSTHIRSTKATRCRDCIFWTAARRQKRLSKKLKWLSKK
jgi:transposase